jgi:hypothetical protein
MQKNNNLGEQEALDLAKMLEIPTEPKDVPTFKPAGPAEEQPIAQPGAAGLQAPGAAEKLTTADLPNLNDAADNLITMIEMAEGTVLTAIVSAKNYFSLNADERKKVAEALKKPKTQRTEEEQHLIDMKAQNSAKSQAKLDSIEWTETEIQKLRKPARLLVKQNNMKISPEWALILGVINIVGDHCIDVFMD